MIRKLLTVFSAIVLATILIPDLALGQIRLEGTVTDPDNQPVEGAEVYLLELKKGAVTDAEGNFTFDKLPSGTFTLSVSHIGYRKTSRTIILKNEEKKSVVVQLDVRIIKDNPILVTGDRIRTLTQTSLNSLVIDADQLASSGEPTLWDAVEQYPGIDIETNGPGIQRPVIRGLSTNRIKVLNRGTEYHYQKWDPESGLSMNGNNTEQVEIIRGPASLMYGSGAMGGVISLAQDQPAPRGKTVGNYQLGLFSNTLGINNQLSLKSGSENYFWGLSGSFDSHADYESGEGEIIRNSRYNNMQIQANGGLTRSWGTTRLTYEYLQQKNGIIETEEEPDLTNGEEEEKGREIERPYHNLVNHSLTSETDWYRENTHLNLTLALQSNTQQEFEPVPATGPAEEEAAMDLILNSLNYRASISQQITSGLELNTGFHGNVKENESKGEETFVPSADYFDLGFFAIANWETSESVTIEGGGRYDLNKLETRAPEEGQAGDRLFNIPQKVDRNFNHASGSIGISFHPTDTWTIKSNLGIGYRTPNIAELTADGLLREIKRYEIGDNALSAESNVEGDISLQYAQNNFSISASGFYNLIDNYIYQERDGSIVLGNPPNLTAYPVFRFKQDRAILSGGEAGIAIHPEASPWFNFESQFSVVIGQNKELDEPLPMIPAPSLINTLVLKKKSWGSLKNSTLSLSLRKFFEQTRNASFEEETPGYWLTDVKIGSNIPLGSSQLQLTLAVKNLFDVDYVSHLSLLKYEDIRNRGRNISLTARIPFNL